MPTSVSDYLRAFRNIVLMIPGVSEGEQIDRFCQGLEPHIKLEVLKAGARSMDEAAGIALNVDSAMSGAGMLPFQAQGRKYFDSRSFGPLSTPMEIGNVERQRNRVGRGFSRRKDLLNNACFTWQKDECRAWKYNERKTRNDRRRGDWKTPANVDIEESCGASARNTRSGN